MDVQADARVAAPGLVVEIVETVVAAVVMVLRGFSK